MAKANSESSSSGSPHPPTPSPNNNKAERPPFPKKTKTSTSSSSSSISDDTHFPGPLFPAVRRISASPPPPSSLLQLRSDLRVSVCETDVPSPIPMSLGSSFVDHSDNSSFSDRDWMYPSFLGPHVVRNRVTLKGRRGITNSTITEEKERVKEEERIVGVTRPSVDILMRKDDKVKVEKKVKEPTSQVLTSQSSSGFLSSSRATQAQWLRFSFSYYYLVLSLKAP